MVVFSLAVVRDPAVKYSNPDGTIQNRSPAYLSEYASAARRVGDNDEDWTTIMMTRRSYEPRNAVIGMLPHLPQVVS